jgi:hypothetical protein
VRKKRRANRSAERRRAPTRKDVGLEVDDDATPEQIEAILTRLHQIIGRVEQQQLEPGDWDVVQVLLREAM